MYGTADSKRNHQEIANKRGGGGGGGKEMKKERKKHVELQCDHALYSNLCDLPQHTALWKYESVNAHKSNAEEEARAVVTTNHSEKLDELSSNNDTVTNQQEYYLMMIQ